VGPPPLNSLENTYEYVSYGRSGFNRARKPSKPSRKLKRRLGLVPRRLGLVPRRQTQYANGQRLKKFKGGKRLPHASSETDIVIDPQDSYVSYDTVVHYEDPPPPPPPVTTLEKTYEYVHYGRAGLNRGRKPSRPNRKLKRRLGSVSHRQKQYVNGQRLERHKGGKRLPHASSETDIVIDPQDSYVSYDTVVHYEEPPPPPPVTTLEKTYEYVHYGRAGLNRVRKPSRPKQKLKRRLASSPQHQKHYSGGQKRKQYKGGNRLPQASSEADTIGDPQLSYITYDTVVFPTYISPPLTTLEKTYEYVDYFRGRSAPGKGKRAKNPRPNKRLKKTEGKTAVAKEPPATPAAPAGPPAPAPTPSPTKTKTKKAVQPQVSTLSNISFTQPCLDD
jgi:hypothetical protein